MIKFKNLIDTGKLLLGDGILDLLIVQLDNSRTIQAIIGKRDDRWLLRCLVLLIGLNMIKVRWLSILLGCLFNVS